MQGQLQKFFENKFPRKGKYYGYVLPAHKKLVQAAGRVHRSEEEKGAVIVLDYRLLWSNVRKDLPDWMKETIKPVTLVSMKRHLIDFYRGEKIKVSAPIRLNRSVKTIQKPFLAVLMSFWFLMIS